MPEANVRVLVELAAALVEVGLVGQCGAEISKHHLRNVGLSAGLGGLQVRSRLRLKVQRGYVSQSAVPLI